MESLDLVYNSLTKLEQNFARSKKSRSEYISEKLGGDVNIGSFLILHALSKETLTSPEDVDKLSTVRAILGKIREHQGDLDKLSSFDFEAEDNGFNALLDAMGEAELDGTHVAVVKQDELCRALGYLQQFYADRNAATVVPLNTAPYILCYNEAIASLISGISGQSFSVGDVAVRRFGGRYEKSAGPDWW